LDISLFAGATDDRGILLVDHHLLGAAHHVKLHVLKLDAEILGDCGAAGQHSDSTSSAMMSSGSPACTTDSRSGKRSGDRSDSRGAHNLRATSLRMPILGSTGE
jgi:hypothetical protein